MSPEIQRILRFAGQYTVAPRATVPQLYHDTPLRFSGRVAHKRGEATA